MVTRFVVGLLVSITSVGSGTLIVALLALTTTLPARSIVGTDIVHALALVAVATAAHLSIGSIDVGLTVNLLAGAIPGVLVGSRLGVRLPERALRPTLGVVLLERPLVAVAVVGEIGHVLNRKKTALPNT